MFAFPDTHFLSLFTKVSKALPGPSCSLLSVGNSLRERPFQPLWEGPGLGREAVWVSLHRAHWALVSPWWPGWGRSYRTPEGEADLVPLMSLAFASRKPSKEFQCFLSLSLSCSLSLGLGTLAFPKSQFRRISILSMADNGSYRTENRAPTACDISQIVTQTGFTRR